MPRPRFLFPDGRRGLLLAAALPVAILVGALAWRGELTVGVFALAAVGFVVTAGAIGLGGTRPGLGLPLPAPSRRPGANASSVFPDPAILVDRRAVVVEANAAAFALFPALALRRPLAFALRDPDLLAAVPAALATGEGASVEIGGRVPGEAAHAVRLRRIGQAETSLGEPAVALFFRDVSAERRSERMRVDFIANVSHELRTPLASLSGFIETLQGPAREDPEARARFLDIMGRQAGRMTRLVNDLLQLSRTELREHVRPSERVELSGEVAHMLEILAPRARERGASFAVALEPDLTVLGDRDELLRLVENLVENAIRYGGAGAPIEIALRRLPAGPSAPGGAAELRVRDHGPGIAAEHIPRLTERFYRVDVVESRQSGGTGLGLAIVKHIVGRHRGRLAIESRPGHGAAFVVTMPLAG